MKKFSVLVCALFLMFGSCGAADANSWFFSVTSNGNNYVSPYAGLAGFYTEDFQDATYIWGWSSGSSFSLVTGSVSGSYAAPMGVTEQDTTQYLVVPGSGAGASGSATAILNGTYNYLGIWWGSIDAYNTLTFNFYDTSSHLIASYTGTDIVNGAANGSWTESGSNKYLNIILDSGFNSFTITSTSRAFEADNITVGTVPEPSILLLLGGGLVALPALKKKYKAA